MLIKSKSISCAKLSEKKLGVTWDVPIYLSHCNGDNFVLDYIKVSLRYKLISDGLYEMKYFKNIEHALNKISKKFGIKKKKIKVFFTDRLLLGLVPTEIDFYILIIDDNLWTKTKREEKLNEILKL